MPQLADGVGPPARSMPTTPGRCTAVSTTASSTAAGNGGNELRCARVRGLRFFRADVPAQLEHIRRTVEALEGAKIRHALVGGHAASYHWQHRGTLDIDFIVAMRSLKKAGKVVGE